MRVISAFKWARDPHNQYGQLGDGTLEDRLTPTPVVGISATALALGGRHSCAQVGAGAWCWGNNGDGQLGDGTETDRAAPSRVTGLDDVTALSAGNAFTCALRSTGQVACWGDNRQRQLGDPSRNYFDDSPTPVAVVGVSAATTISAGAKEACIQLADGEVLCWGDLEELPMGEGSVGDGGPMARGIPELRGFESLFASSAHRCALRAGEVFCWAGVNRHGEIGDGTVNPVDTPTRARCLSGVQELALGHDFSCARYGMGAVSCWGHNGYGELGDGTTHNRLTPVAVRGLPASP